MTPRSWFSGLAICLTAVSAVACGRIYSGDDQWAVAIRNECGEPLLVQVDAGESAALDKLSENPWIIEPGATQVHGIVAPAGSADPTSFFIAYQRGSHTAGTNTLSVPVERMIDAVPIISMGPECEGLITEDGNYEGPGAEARFEGTPDASAARPTEQVDSQRDQ